MFSATFEFWCFPSCMPHYPLPLPGVVGLTIWPYPRSKSCWWGEDSVFKFPNFPNQDSWAWPYLPLGRVASLFVLYWQPIRLQHFSRGLVTLPLASLKPQFTMLWFSHLIKSVNTHLYSWRCYIIQQLHNQQNKSKIGVLTEGRATPNYTQHGFFVASVPGSPFSFLSSLQ